MPISFDHIPPELRKKVEADIESRDRGEGYAFDLDNDWDLHLYSMLLRQTGKNKDEVRGILADLPLLEVPAVKRESYIEDILNSCVVGFESPERALPVYIKAGGK